MIKKSFRILFVLYGFGANLLTYITGVHSILEFIDAKGWMCAFMIRLLLVVINPILLFILILYASIWLLLYLTLPYRKDIGTHGIECKFLMLFTYKRGIRARKILRIIHKNLYHQAYEIRDGIRKGNTADYDALQRPISDFLQTVNFSIKQVFGIDLTINVKRISFDNKNNPILTPYAYYRNTCAKSPSHTRSFDYRYALEANPLGVFSLKDYASRAENYNKSNANRNFKINSVFNYLLNDKKAYWMSNDLSKDIGSKIFYTSSDNYPQCYKSLAIFKIVPPEKDVIPEGLIVFDSERIGIFSEEECAQLMGLIAHLLYEIFLEMNNNEKKK